MWQDATYAIHCMKQTENMKTKQYKIIVTLPPQLHFNGAFLYSPSLNKTVSSCPQFNEAVANWQNLI